MSSPGHGMGIDFVRAARTAGHQVVATGRCPAAVEQAIGTNQSLLAVKLDIAVPTDAEAATPQKAMTDEHRHTRMKMAEPCGVAKLLRNDMEVLL